MRRVGRVVAAAAVTMSMVVAATAPAVADDGAGLLTVVVDKDCSQVAADDCDFARPWVTVEDADGTVHGSGWLFDGTWTPSDGVEAENEFSVDGLQPGDYFVTVRDEADDAVAADHVPVTVGNGSQLLRVAYQPQPSASVTVRVTGIDGDVWGIGDAYLEAPDGTVRADYWGTSSADVYTFRTRVFGQWRLRIDADAGQVGYLPTYYPGVADADAAELIDITPGAQLALSMDALPGGRITGRIDGPALDPQFARGVTLYTTDGRHAYDTPAWPDGTGGEYVISGRSLDRAGIAPGSYLVKFEGGEGFASRYYDGADGSLSMAGAKPVTLVGGEITENVDVALTACGSISGRVTGLDQWPQMTLWGISATNLDDDTSSRSGWRDEDGEFKITGLAPGRYSVSAGGHSYDPKISATYYSGGDTTSGKTVTVESCGSAVTGADIAVTMTNTARPTLSGPPAVGTAISVKPGTWNVPNATYAYTWLRDGAAIQGATSSSYRPVAADAGHQLSARITARHVDYRDATSTTTSAKVLPGPAPRATSAPTIGGSAKVGSLLTATQGRWSTSGVTVRFQWLRSGRAIPGASTSSYRVSTSDVGARLSVKVTATKSGYTSASTTTGSTAVVPKVKPTVTGTPAATTIRRTTTPKVAVTVKATGVRAPVGTVTVKVGTTTKKVSLTASNKGKVVVSLPRKRGPRTYPVVVTFTPSSTAAKYLTGASARAHSIKVV
ncbi:hypothetical protein GCM10009809_40070 [Isoptericola hypogeus]|uniref:Alpha-amylase n=1 Tax=Isoptericola hypogeus TaxID=300179 RepID=A0ABN2JW59_9MICO